MRRCAYRKTRLDGGRGLLHVGRLTPHTDKKL